MPEADPDRGSARFTAEANAQNHFSWIRTRLSAERTLMAYDRTAIALIGFGFTIYQFLAKLNVTKGVAPPAHVNAPQILGLILITAGLALLAAGLYGYRSLVAYLYVPHFQTVAPKIKHWHSGTPLTASLLFLAGAFAFVAVLLRV